MFVSFCGLKENIGIGRTAIREVKQEYPRGFVSNSKYDTFSIQRNKRISDMLAKKILKTREIVEHEMKFGKTKIEAVQEAVRITGTANCSEQAMLVSDKLKKAGIENKVVSMCVYKETKYSTEFVDGHTFCVIGLADDAVISKPETWGKDAVVVDMWKGIVDKAPKAISEFTKMLNYDKKNTKLIFSKESVI